MEQSHRLTSATILSLIFLLAGPALAQQAKLSPGLANKVIQTVDADAKRITEIFKDIHQHPEHGFMETRTAGIVAKELKALGYEVKTGIVGIMKNGEGPVVLYRGEMDAVAAKEATVVPLPW